MTDIPVFKVKGRLLEDFERIDRLEYQVVELAHRIARFERLFAELGRDCDPDASIDSLLRTA